MTDVTIHTGFMGDEALVTVDWYDHDNVRRMEVVRFAIVQEKPRTLAIEINGKVVWNRLGCRGGETFA